MKKILLIACGLAAFAAVISTARTPEQASDLVIDNIEVMGLSGSETICDPDTKTDCELYENNQVIGKGKGTLKHWS